MQPAADQTSLILISATWVPVEKRRTGILPEASVAESPIA